MHICILHIQIEQILHCVSLFIRKFIVCAVNRRVIRLQFVPSRFMLRMLMIMIKKMRYTLYRNEFEDNGRFRKYDLASWILRTYVCFYAKGKKLVDLETLKPSSIGLSLIVDVSKIFNAMAILYSTQTRLAII